MRSKRAKHVKSNNLTALLLRVSLHQPPPALDFSHLVHRLVVISFSVFLNHSSECVVFSRRAGCCFFEVCVCPEHFIS